MSPAPASLIGFWYALGPADKAFDPGDRDWAVHVIIADGHDVPGCVTVRNPAGQCFPLDRPLALSIALPPPATADHPGLRRRKTVLQTGASVSAMAETGGSVTPTETANADDGVKPCATRGWGATPVPPILHGRSVLGAFAAGTDQTLWTVLCDAATDGGALLIGQWTPGAPGTLHDPVAHASAFKAVLAFETARAAARTEPTG
jgi:hypothetical protein